MQCVIVHSQQFRDLATILSQIMATRSEALDVRALSEARSDALTAITNAKTLLSSRQMTALWAQNLSTGDVALSSAISATVTMYVDEASSDLKKKQKILEDIDANLAEKRIASDIFIIRTAWISPCVLG